MEQCGTESAVGFAPVRCEVRRAVQGRKNGPHRRVETVKVSAFTVSGTGLAYACSRLADGRTLSSTRGVTTPQNRERNASAAEQVRGRGRVFEESASSSHAIRPQPLFLQTMLRK